MLRLPAAFVRAAATPGEAVMLPSWPPNSTAHIRPRPRTSMMGNLSASCTSPCTLPMSCYKFFAIKPVASEQPESNRIH